VEAHFGQEKSKERLSEMKNYLLSQVISFDGFNGIKTTSTNQIEMNPSVGLPGFIQMLTLKTAGILHVEEGELTFDKTEIGSTNTKSILLQNLGESSIDVSWNDSEISDTFSAELSAITIESQEEYQLDITFQPTVEEVTSVIWIITDESVEFTLALSGQGFDLPTLSLTSSVENGSFIESHKMISFELTVTDSSDIATVTVSFGDTVDVLNIDPTSQKYFAEINTNALSNGTYSLTFSATDVLSNTGSIIFEFDVGVYKSNLIDEAVSDTTRNILIGVGIVLLIVAVIVTRRYMK
jgi:hypothetical protein